MTLELISKVTLLLALGALAAELVRGRSSGTRHFVWGLTLLAVLALPLVLQVAPRISLPVKVSAPLPELPLLGGSPPPLEFLPVDTEVVVATDSAAPSKSPPSPGEVLWVIWLLGCAVLLTRCALGHLGLGRLARRATPLREESFDRLLFQALAESGSTRIVKVALSSEVGAPVTWGWRRPIILLPVGADLWTEERVKVVLSHELAHVARGDYLMQVVAQVACAIYWFHPLVWFAARGLRTESEHACDDRVLDHGAPGPDYAAHLLDLARGARSLRMIDVVALSMAGPSHLERRLEALLDEERPRRSLPFLARVFAIVLLGGLLIPFAGLWAEVGSVPMLPVERPVELAVERPVERAVVATDEAFGRELAASPGELLRIFKAMGGTIEIAGWDQDRVGVRASGELELRRNGDVVQLSILHGRSSRVQIRVPRRFDVEIESGAGAISISEVEGTFSGRTGGGPIKLDRLRGRASLLTGGGGIEVTDSHLDGHVTTGGGGVRLIRVTGDLSGKSGSGPVEYEKDNIPHVERAGGNITLEEAPRGAIVSTGGGNIRVGRAAGLVRARTGGGNITLGPVAGSVRAKTGAGNVTVEIVDAGGQRQTVEIGTGSGNVVVELPRDIDATFDIEAQHASGRGKPVIQSAWSLEQTEPGRKHGEHGGSGWARARGKTGSGRNLVRIRTSNGRVDLRAR